MYSSTLSLTPALDEVGVGGQRPTSAVLPPVKTRHPLYTRLCGSQGRSGRVPKILPPTEIRSPDGPASSESLYQLRYPGLIYAIISLSFFRIKETFRRRSGYHFTHTVIPSIQLVYSHYSRWKMTDFRRSWGISASGPERLLLFA